MISRLAAFYARPAFSPAVVLPALFFVSGFAAIIYQVVWQRVLFSAFGINSESVTLVVSVFMAGLGLGGLFGGWVQKRFPTRLLESFVVIECAIGAYGLISLSLIRHAGLIAPPDSMVTLFGIVLVLFLLPTMLMGATLPILVTYLERTVQSVGQSLGRLYAMNTLGSAVAALVTVNVLFVYMGLQASIVVACICNVITGFAGICICRWFLSRKDILAEEETRQLVLVENESTVSLAHALMLSCAMGFVALGLQVLWYRLVDFMVSGRSGTFGMLLFVTLCGIAGGALAVMREVRSGGDMGQFVMKSLTSLVCIMLVSFPILMILPDNVRMMQAYVCFMLLGLQANKLGGIFPALCHMSIQSKHQSQAGVAVGYIYCANIVGSVIGCLLMGLVLFDQFSITQNMMLMIVVTVGCAAWSVRAFLLPQHRKFAWAGCATVAMMMLVYPFVVADFFAGIRITSSKLPFTHVVENRSGVITVESNPTGDVIFGGGVYDGRFNIDPVNDSNMITRAYMIAALHPRPKRILEIGLSSGSWASAISSYAPLEKLTSVEINSGYRGLLSYYDATKKVPTNPKVDMVHDDGRRWLKTHQNQKFDLIVSNTSFHWRNNSTNLLSVEFLELAKLHLNEGGVVFINSTSAADCFYTAAHVFKHVVMIKNFVAASDAPFVMNAAQKRANFLQFKQADGTALFDKDSAHKKVMETLIADPLKDWHDELLKNTSLWLITDDNMATEYKIGRVSPQLYQSVWGKW